MRREYQQKVQKPIFGYPKMTKIIFLKIPKFQKCVHGAWGTPVIKNVMRWLSTLRRSNLQDITIPSYIQLSDSLLDKGDDFIRDFLQSMTVHENFLGDAEEKGIMNEIEPYLKRMRYEYDHWDDAIHGYRETERLKWNAENTKVLDRVRSLAFPPHVGQLKFVHILDLEKKGYIKPHIDAVRFCGDTIAGLSLLTDSVMRLIHAEEKTLTAIILLKRQSLYIMKDTARYHYTHEILPNEQSIFNGRNILKDRRVSIICRNEPKPEDKQ